MNLDEFQIIFWCLVKNQRKLPPPEPSKNFGKNFGADKRENIPRLPRPSLSLYFRANPSSILTLSLSLSRSDAATAASCSAGFSRRRRTTPRSGLLLPRRRLWDTDLLPPRRRLRDTDLLPPRHRLRDPDLLPPHCRT